MKNLLWAALGMIGLLGCTRPVINNAPPAPQLDLPKITLTVGDTQIQAQRAQTLAQQEKGLMYRQAMPENEGMLFEYTQAQTRCFWMKNTLLPLSIAYIDKNWQIIDIQEMQAASEALHCSAKPAQYALEMNQGWFTRHAVSVGQTIKLAAPNH